MRFNFLKPAKSVCSIALLLTCALAQGAHHPCKDCAEWNQPQSPFRIFGDTYYVGPHGLSSVLITSAAGHILIDGALPESTEQISANIRSLGFRIEDVKIILNSHVHFDHAGGIAELQRLSGARVLASPWSAAVMRTGRVGQGDPQLGIIDGISPIKNVHELRDGESFAVGELRVTAHFTPGHTPGGTSWTWRSCEKDVCRNFVYADSLTPVSAPGFRFSDSRTYPQSLDDFERSFKFLEDAPCDILLTTHPDSSAFWDRVAPRARADGSNPLVNPEACRDLAQRGREQLRQRLDEERKNPAIKHAKK